MCNTCNSVRLRVCQKKSSTAPASNTDNVSNGTLANVDIVITNTSALKTNPAEGQAHELIPPIPAEVPSQCDEGENTCNADKSPPLTPIKSTAYLNTDKSPKNTETEYDRGMHERIGHTTKSPPKAEAPRKLPPLHLPNRALLSPSKVKSGPSFMADNIPTRVPPGLKLPQLSSPDTIPKEAHYATHLPQNDNQLNKQVSPSPNKNRKRPNKAKKLVQDNKGEEHTDVGNGVPESESKETSTRGKHSKNYKLKGIRVITTPSESELPMQIEPSEHRFDADIPDMAEMEGERDFLGCASHSDEVDEPRIRRS